MKSSIKILSIGIALILTAPVYAQIVGSNAYMQGIYVEIGVNQCGAYGSDEAPPDGYHSSYDIAPFGTYISTEGMGFIADSEEDGMETGTDIDFCGDYFVPGSPVEGWQVQIEGDVYTNTDQFCSPYAVPGSISSYSYDGGLYTVTWEGTVDDYDVGITQITTMPEDKVYFVTRVLFCNNGTEAVNDVYYNRNVDPDNDVVWSGDFTTYNEIIYNPPTDDKALVVSTGLTYGCYLGIGALDPNARVTYGNFSTTAGTPEDVWNGEAGYSLDGSETNDIANSIAFYIPTINPGECKCIAFAYILDEDDLEEALNATLTYSLSVNGTGIPSGGSYGVCNVGDTANLAIVGADTSYTWSWAPAIGLSGTDGTVVTATVTDTITYTATGVGGFCGDATIEITLFPDDDELSDAGDDTEICFGLSTPLSGDGGVSDSIYTWSPATGLSDPNIPNPIASPTSTTNYVLTTIDNWGCPAYDTIQVTVNPLPDVDAGPDVAICIDGQVTFDATGAVDYEWSPADGLSPTTGANPVCTVDDETTYTVTGTDENGCINTDDITVSVNYLPPVTASADPIFIDTYAGETSQLNATGAETYSWTPVTGLSDPNIANPVASPGDTTTYIVAGTDQYGCVNYDTITLYAIGEITIDIPNAFTPNGDGINDLFYPIVQGSGELDDFSIFNRWGELVHKAVVENDGWDGKQNGKDAEMGSYVIIVNAHTSDGKIRYKQSYFILVR